MVALLNNRAHILLQLKELVRCVEDCKRALEIDPKSVKAYYRAAKASVLNGLYQQAIDFCTKGLEAEPEHADLQNMLDAARKKLDEQMVKKQKLDISPNELMEMQENMNRLGNQLRMCSQQVQVAQGRRRSYELTTSGFLTTLEENTGTYVAIGRGFFHTSRDKVQSGFQKKIDDINEELPKLMKAQLDMKTRHDKMTKEFTEAIAYLKATGAVKMGAAR